MDTWNEKKGEVKDDAKILVRLHEWGYVKMEGMAGEFRSRTWFVEGRCCSVCSWGHMEFEGIIHSTGI